MHKFFPFFLLLSVLFLLSACSTNPATGRSQFIGLMSSQQEASTGAQEHQKVLQEFGLYDDKALQSYVSEIGQKLVPYTERQGVQYQFFLLDSDMVNAFALPGGYVYVTRGLLALANSEAELAGVIGHEIGHVTGKHAAERYSRSVVTALGTSVLAAAIDNNTASKALNTGADLYLKSYSRAQENEADQLGVRYIYRAGYDQFAMSRFLNSLAAETVLDQKLNRGSTPPAFLSTHPDTAARVGTTAQLGGSYAANPRAVINREGYLQKINGLAYGNAGNEGLVEGRSFIHPKLGFKFNILAGFEVDNQDKAVIAKDSSGAIMIFDFGRSEQALGPESYLGAVWMQSEPIGSIENVNVNGMRAATALYNGRVNSRPMKIRLVAIEWGDKTFARFQIAMPMNIPPAAEKGLRDAIYSFQKLSSSQKDTYKAERIQLITANAGASVASLSARQSFGKYNDARFRVLNGLSSNDGLEVGKLYKLVVR